MANRNISNSDQLEEEISRRLKEVDKSYADFLTVLAFESRTPLTTISAYSQLLLESKDEPLTETQRKFVTSIQQSAIRLREIEQYVHDIARVARDYLYLSIADVDLKDIIAKAIPPYWREGYKQIEFEQNIPEGLPVIQADERLIYQILQSLFSSASARLSDGGKITLTTTYDDHQITICIADTGSSIAASTLTAVDSTETSVYWRMEHNDWLLAISRYLIKKHSVIMQIETEDGKGSLVTFTLPIQGPIKEQS